MKKYNTLFNSIKSLATIIGVALLFCLPNLVLGQTVSSGSTLTISTNQTLANVTVDVGGTLIVDATLTISGTCTVNGTFQINQGGYATGGTWTYGSSSTLVYNNTSGVYGVNSGHVYWPSSNSPANVTVQGAGGIDLGVSRTVSGTFQTAAGVTLSNSAALTLNGLCQINASGFFGNSPTYGTSSILKYNTGGTYGASNEWVANATSGAGVPQNVQINSGTTLNFGAQTGYSQANGNITINSGGTFTLSTGIGGDVKLGGDWTNSGTFTPNSRAVFFVGASNDQNITGATTFDYCTVDKTTGGLVPANDITCNQILDLKNGKITTNANKVIISSTGSITRTNGYVIGNLQKNVATGATSRTFELGDATNYTPLSISFGSVTTAGNLTAKVTASAHPNIGTATALSNAKYINRYWVVTNSGTAFNNYSATFTFVSGDIQGSANTSALKLGKYDASTWTYPTVSANTATTATATGMTAFSDFVLAECGNLTTFNVTGGGAYCAGGTGVVVSLSGSVMGVNYQLIQGGSTNVGSPVAGTGSALSFGLQTTVGAYTVLATNAANCTTTMTGSATVSTNAVTAIGTQPAATQTVCQSATPTDISVTATGTSPTYQWYSNVSNSNSGGTLISGSISNTYTPITTIASTTYYYCVVTGTCGTVASTTSEVIVTPTATPAVSIAVSSGSNPSCAGPMSITFTATPTLGGATPQYQWKRNGLNAMGFPNSTSVSFTPMTPLQNGDLITVDMVSNATCANPTTVTSNQITIVINPVPSITLGTVAAICEGATSFSIPYSATSNGANRFSLTNVPSGPAALSGFTNISNQTLTSTPLSISIPNGSAAGTYSFTLTVTNNTTGCVSGTYPVSMTINATPSAPATPVASVVQPTCAVSTATITVVSATSSLRFSLDGSDYSNTTGVFNTISSGSYALTSRSTDNCVSAIRSITIDAQPNCANPTIPTSNLVAYYPFNGNANDASSNANNGTVSNASLSADRFCNANSAYDFSGNVNSYIEAPDVAALHMQSFTLSMWVNNRSTSGVSVILTKTIGTGNCDSWTVFQHGGVNNAPFAAVSCYSQNSGDFGPVLYADRTNNVWTHLIYMVDDVNHIVRFYKDGVLVDSRPWTGSITYDNRPLQIGVSYENNVLDFGFNGKIDDIRIYDRALNTAEVLALSSETSATATITAQTTAAATYCPNAAATPLSVTATGSNLTYQWYSNTTNVNTGGTSLGASAQTATYTPSTINAGTTYYFCEVTSGCNSVRSAVSGAIVVNPIVTPSVSIAVSSGSNPTCTGSSVVFTATPTNGGTSPSYQWTKGGNIVGTNSPTYTDAGTTGGVIACVMTVGTGICVNTTTATATDITLTTNTPTAAGALKFDGSNDYVNIGGGFDKQVFTIEMWLKPGASQVQYADIIDNNHQNQINWVCQSQGGNTYGFGANAASVNFTLTADTWQHLALVKEDKMIRVYVNGVLIQSAYHPNAVNYNGAQTLKLGAWGGGGRNWNGEMDEVRIWERVLCADEISSHISCELSGTQTGLWAYYKANQGFAGCNNTSLTTLTDETGNHNGTLQGFDLTGTNSNFTAGQVTGACATVGSSPLTTYYRDADGDGLGDPSVLAHSCSLPTDFVTNNTDCNDNIPINAGSTIAGSVTVCSGNNSGNLTLSNATTVSEWQSSTTSDFSSNITSIANTSNSLNFSNLLVTTYYRAVITSGACVAATSSIATVTVTPLPSTPSVSAGSTTTFCSGGSVTLTSSATTGNQWYKDNVLISSAIDATYSATASGAYTVVVTANSCSSAPSDATTVTVNTISSTPSVSTTTATTFCAGGSVTLTSGTPTGNQWYRNSNLISGATAQTYAATTNGTYTVVVTASGCPSAASNAITVVVNAKPSAPIVANIDQPHCLSGGGTTLGDITLTTVSAEQYNIDGSTFQTVSQFFSTSPGTYSIRARNADGCISDPTSVTINPRPTLPASQTVTLDNGSAYCAGGTGVQLRLGGSETGVNYQVKMGSTDIGSPIAGTGNALPLGLQTAAGTYVVYAIKTDGCTSIMSQTPTLSIIPLPIVYTVTGGGAYCASGTGVAVGLSYSEMNVVNYQLKKDGVDVGSPVTGTGNAISFGLQTAAGTYTVEATNSFGCTATMSSSAVVTVNALPSVNVGSSPMTPICVGGTTPALGGFYGGSATAAVWTDGGAGGIFSNNGGTTPNTTTYTAPNSPTTVTLTLTTSGGSCGTTSASKGLAVLSISTPSVVIAITNGTSTTCNGSTVTFMATPTNGGTSPSYQWKKGSTNVGTNSNTYTDAAETGGVISCVMTVGTNICTNAATATSSDITLIVNNCTLNLSAKVFIHGAYNTITGLMNDGLRSNGKIPTSQPYNTLIFNNSTAYTGSETVTQSVLNVTGNNAIVDWVLIELRDAANPSNVPTNGRRAALLQRDGDIVDIDGTSVVRFPSLSEGTYHVIIRHRLCLATRTNTAVSFSYSSTPSVNFTNNSNALSSSQKLLATGVYGLYIGDTDRSGLITSGDAGRVRERNPTTIPYFSYTYGYDLEFNSAIFASDASIVRGNLAFYQVNLNQ